MNRLFTAGMGWISIPTVVMPPPGPASTDTPIGCVSEPSITVRLVTLKPRITAQGEMNRFMQLHSLNIHVDLIFISTWKH